MVRLLDATGTSSVAAKISWTYMGDDPQVPATPADSAASSSTSISEKMSEDLKARVINVIAKTQRIPLETVSIDSTFEELKIDSLDGINLIFALESEFNVDIPDDNARAIKSVRQMAEGIAQLVAQKAPAEGAA
jgi:acyl carrier protein